MKTILVPVDFSPVSDNAMRFAVDMAKHLQASLRLINIYQLPVAVNEVPMPMMNISVDELQRGSDDKLRDLKAGIEKITSGGIMVSTEARLGNVMDELKNECDAYHPFAVVMGSREISGLERILFGSTTLAAIKHLNVPVLVIPPGAKFKPVHKIGLACDFKDVLSTTPDKEIHTMVKAFEAELHVLNVDHNGKHFKGDTPEKSFELHNLLADLKPKYHFIDHENVEEGILKFAETNNLDFLIIIPKKHNLLEGLFHKSHTRELAFHSHVPVMAIHED